MPRPTPNPELSAVTGTDLLRVLAAIGLGLLALLGGVFLLIRYRMLDAVDAGRLDLAFGFTAYAIVLAAVWVVAIRRGARVWPDIGLRRCDPTLFAAGGLLAFLWIAVTAALYSALGLWEAALAAGANIIAPFRGDTLGLAGLVLLAGPVAALVEEILFRGLIYGWLRQKTGVAAAAAASAVLFTLAHAYVFVAGPALFFEMIALAVLLALLFEASRSLWPGILCHALNNMLLLGLYLYNG